MPEYRPNASPEHQHPDDGYIILLGEDLEEYTLQGYRDGGCDPGEELHDLSCTITRYETTLGELLAQLMPDYLKEMIRQLEGDHFGVTPPQGIPSNELYLGLAAELLESYGQIGTTPVERYDTGMLEDIFSAVYTNGRVIYFSFDVTIPAGESVSVEAVLHDDMLHCLVLPQYGGYYIIDDRPEDDRFIRESDEDLYNKLVSLFE